MVNRIWMFSSSISSLAIISMVVDGVPCHVKVCFAASQVNVILEDDILHVHFAVGIAHVNLTLPSVVTEAHADAHVGDASTAVQLVFLMLRIDIGCIEQDAPCGLHCEFWLFLSINGGDGYHRHHESHNSCFHHCLRSKNSVFY